MYVRLRRRQEARSVQATAGEQRTGAPARPRSDSFRAAAPRRRQKNGRGLGIETVPVEVVQRSDMLRLTGSLMADERSSVASNTSGIAAEVRVDRGSLVRKNDVLVQIDPTDAKNKLAEGQAMLDELKARLGLDGNIENVQSRGRAGGAAGQGVGRSGRVEPPAGQGTVRQEGHLDRGLRSDADGVRVGHAALSPGAVADQAGVSGLQDGP